MVCEEEEPADPPELSMPILVGRALWLGAAGIALPPDAAPRPALGGLAALFLPEVQMAKLSAEALMPASSWLFLKF